MNQFSCRRTSLDLITNLRVDDGLGNVRQVERELQILHLEVVGARPKAALAIKLADRLFHAERADREFSRCLIQGVGLEVGTALDAHGLELWALGRAVD